MNEDLRQRTEAGRKKYRTRGRMTSSGLSQSCALSYQNAEGFTQSEHRTPTTHSCNATIDATSIARCKSMSIKLQLSDLGNGVICAFDERTVGSTLRGRPREIVIHPPLYRQGLIACHARRRESLRLRVLKTHRHGPAKATHRSELFMERWRCLAPGGRGTLTSVAIFTAVAQF
jgi:hypothetical protein